MFSDGQPNAYHELLKTQARRPGRASRRTVRRLISGGALIIGVALLAYLVIQIRARSPRRGSIARVGQVLPAIPVVDSTGGSWDASKAALGSKTVIVFYSPSCEVCQRELPKLQPFPASLGLIMVNEQDNSSDGIDRLELPYGKQFCDRDQVFNRLSSNPGLPTILFVDEQAILRSALVGEHPADVLHDRLRQFATAQSHKD